MYKQSNLKELWRRLKKNKAAMIGLGIFFVFVLLAIFADQIANYDKVVIAQNAKDRLQPMSLIHLFGTDEFGRDEFARVVHGTRISLEIGLSATLLSLLCGGLLGAIAGYFGGKISSVIMNVMDTIMCIPAILMALAIVASLGPNMINLIIAITVAQAPGFARLVRSMVMIVAGQEYVEAAKACGTGNFRIIYKHIIPNVLGPIIVQATMSVGGMIISAAALSFMGMGVQPPAPEWGAMLSSSGEFIRRCPNLVWFPGMSIVLLTLSLNLFGDGLRDALDPRLRD